MVTKTDLLMGFEFEFIAPFDKETLKKKIKEDLNICFSGVKSKKWQIVWDASVSIKGNPRYYPHELISPPKPYYESLKILHQILIWMKVNKCKTNCSCSLQVNISFRNTSFNKKINILKLLLLYPEKEILKSFKRTKNNFCVSQLKILKNHTYSEYEYSYINSISIMEEFYTSKMRINAHKFQALNIINWKKHLNKYIEFRGIGNSNYEYREITIKKYIDAIACAMLYSISKTIHKSEYVIRLKDLIRRK